MNPARDRTTSPSTARPEPKIFIQTDGLCAIDLGDATYEQVSQAAQRFIQDGGAGLIAIQWQKASVPAVTLVTWRNSMNRLRECVSEYTSIYGLDLKIEGQDEIVAGTHITLDGFRVTDANEFVLRRFAELGRGFLEEHSKKT